MPSKYAIVVVVCHNVPIGQSASAISELTSGQSNHAADFNKTLTGEDRGDRFTIIVIDTTSSAAGIKQGMNFLTKKFGARPPTVKAPSLVPENPSVGALEDWTRRAAHPEVARIALRNVNSLSHSR